MAIDPLCVMPLIYEGVYLALLTLNKGCSRGKQHLAATRLLRTVDIELVDLGAVCTSGGEHLLLLALELGVCFSWIPCHVFRCWMR